MRMKCCISWASSRAFGVLREGFPAVVGARHTPTDTSLAGTRPGQAHSAQTYRGAAENRVLYEDNHIICIYKPAGLLSQGNGSSADDNALDIYKEYIREKYNKKGAAYLGLVHRLDRRTSGMLVFGKTSKASQRLASAFAAREVTKRYICLVEGSLRRSGVVSDWLVPSTGSGDPTRVVPEIRASVDGALYAELEISPLCVLAAAASAPSTKAPSTVTLVDVSLKTGRKHQIRAQLSNIGHPIVGDYLYGARSGGGVVSLALHNYLLSVPQVVRQRRSDAAAAGNIAPDGDIKSTRADYNKFLCDTPWEWDILLRKYNVLSENDEDDERNAREILENHLISSYQDRC